MANVLLFNHSVPDIGYYVRTTTVGNELDMVERYVNYISSHYKKLKQKNAAIFIEPQLESGYPDIVIAEYYDKRNNIFSQCDSSNDWNDGRFKLTTSDLKILYYVQSNKRVTKEDISKYLGFSKNEINTSLERLFSCGLIQHTSRLTDKVRQVRLDKYCTITNLIAIEAKIDKWGEAIRQAENNRWFASESYVLMNKISISKNNYDRCQKLGLGIILVNGKIEKNLKSERRKFPISYGSLLFNEWIHKIMYLKEGATLLR